MLTVLFIILKTTHVLHISWWWILLAMALDEEGVRNLRSERE